MIKPGKTSIIIAILAGLLVLGIVFRDFLISSILEPLTIVFWLLLRILMSVDQGVYWGLALLLAVILVVRLVPPQREEYLRRPVIEKDLPVDRVKYWRQLVALSHRDAHSQALNTALLDLLVSTYTLENRGSPAEVREALRSGQMPLPARLHAFLFPAAARPEPAWKRLAGSARAGLAKLQGKSLYASDEMIKEILDYIESRYFPTQ